MAIPPLHFLLKPQTNPTVFEVVRYNTIVEKKRSAAIETLAASKTTTDRAQSPDTLTKDHTSSQSEAATKGHTFPPPSPNMPIEVTYAKTTRQNIQPTNTAPNPKRIDRDNPWAGKPEPTILIIGAGTFGTSTAYHLAHQYADPSKVTVIDQAPSPPKPAASIDVNRVIRTDYASKLYCDLACETIHPWFWSEELGPYFHKVGWLMFEEQGGTLRERIRETFEGRGSTQAYDVDLGKLGEKFECMQGTDTRGFQSSYFNPEAGWCDAAQATHSFMQAAERKGVRRITGKVTELLWNKSSGRVEGAKTEDGRELRAEKIILAAGPWTSQILSPTEEQLNLPFDDRIECQIQATGLIAAYYSMTTEEVNQLNNFQMPVVVYGGLGEIIPPSHQNKLMKYANSKSGIVNSVLTTKSGHRVSVPADQYNVPECLKQETMEMVSGRVLPQFARGKKPDYWRICWDAQSPTEDFLLCPHPDRRLEGLYLATGGSFHSYK